MSRSSALIPQGSRFSSDSYFNALFESHWLHWTSIRSWQLRLELAGIGRVRVLRAGAGRKPEVRHEAPFAGKSCRLTLDIPLPEADGRGTRLYFEVHASGSDVIMQRVEWRAAIDQVRPVALVAGICAFNNEPHVLANVRRLLADERVWQVMRRLVVVDQGEAQALAEEIAEIPGARDRITVINQHNFGGSGGFTRIMLEALDDARATHVLLMDDDVEIDPESIVRTAALLSIASQGVTVGGQELDLSKPTIFRGSGAVLSRKNWLVHTFDRGVDAASTAALDHLATEVAVDFNGWFYFAISLEVVRKIGLPLPFFIVFDDVEYGLRLTQAGIRLACIPGIAIWQQPGKLKEGRWRAYYYQRNVLVINAYHGLGSRTQMTGVFVRRWLRSLLRRDVVQPKLACDAVRDYLSGADVIPTDPSICNRRVIQFCVSAPRKCSNPVGLFRTAARVFASALRLWLNAHRANAEWRRAANQMISVGWWKKYLSLVDRT